MHVRVAIVAESFLPHVNGVSNSVVRVLEHLRAKGHEALVIAPGAVDGQQEASSGEPSGGDEHSGFEVYRVPAAMIPKVSSLPVGLPHMGVYKKMAQFDPDVVHLASPYLLGAGGLAAARRLGVPTVAVFQTDVAGFAASYGLRLLARMAWWWTRKIHVQADRTLAPSSDAIRQLEEHGVPRVRRWARGVDVDGFHPRRRDDALRRAWAPNGELVVGYVGRLAPEKHVERLAPLMREPNVTVVVVGDGVSREKLRKKLPKAVFTGELRGEELARAYASLDVFVHTGEHETFCQAAQEALASGLPVIAPDEGGPRDFVAHCRTGYLLPVADFERALPSAVGSLADGEVRARFSAAARRGVLARTWPRVCDELLAHYWDVQTTSVENAGFNSRDRRLA
ncbi:glycosyl transferase group 1 [Segniliparus rotundus DSM 44985]|uniref:Glycosyl transferase group 1 n=1 Tax=Segniliparus rotundus (strain ATCC BAA-972 / CDC 1076 / CIP 108378 / DSM 44985 / JCM 13578) TaxID=640132 RepID=D6ZD20_SEGRD|nr:glycosyl transferase group 1 [Segniliparus rotundus DSM 44985]